MDKPVIHRHTVSSWKLLGVGFFVSLGWVFANTLVIVLNSPELARLCSTIGKLFE